MLDDLDTVDKAMAFRNFFRSTIKWLERREYIWTSTDLSTMRGQEYDLVLSERGLAALRTAQEAAKPRLFLGR
jgi:hypothetical protein